LGTGVHRLNIGDIRQMRMPLPPLAEQKRIVAKVEEVLAHVNTARDHLARVPALVKRFRQSVLAAACSGRLTEDWHDSHDVEPWTDQRLGDLLREPLRNGHSAQRSKGVGVRTLTLTAVTYGDFSERNTKLSVARPDKVSDLWLEPGDILIERSNTPELVGTTRVYAGPHRFAIFPDLVIRARVRDEVVPRYVEIALQAPASRTYFMESAQGTAGSMPKIDQGIVAATCVPVPPPQEQHEIVRRVDALFALADSIEQRVADATARANALTQATLAKAFRGELVPTEAEHTIKDAGIDSHRRGGR
jgi:type I restriction enzyme S subunit